ncbi:hypothetical protein [Pelagibius sp.]|uniref:hypothetical protein n=1 Tax=Pelagibius sp. TaxID=1931238 RepID=UPI002620F5AA|nr:hypothetical protein [Pelagibius sp.]
MAPDGRLTAESGAPATLNLETGGVDRAALRAYRLARVRAELRRRDYAGALLYDPVNIRYACDSRNMAVW